MFSSKKPLKLSRKNEEDDVVDFEVKKDEKLRLEVTFNDKLFSDKMIEAIRIIIKTKQPGDLSKYEKEISHFKKEYEIKSDVITDEYAAGALIDIFKKYVDRITVKRKVEILGNFICVNCETDIEDVQEIDEGRVICPECQAVNIKHSQPITNIAKENQYFISSGEETVFNHTKILNKLAVKEECVSKETLDMIDDYLRKNESKYIKEKVRIMNYDELSQKTRNIMRIFMKECLNALGLHKQYENMNEILYRYWGWPVPDIEKYFEKVRLLDKELSDYWNKVKHNYNRTAFLLVQFRIYCELKTAGYDECTLDHFNIRQINENSLRVHREVWAGFCAHKGIKNVI